MPGFDSQSDADPSLVNLFRAVEEAGWKRTTDSQPVDLVYVWREVPPKPGEEEAVVTPEVDDREGTERLEVTEL